MVLFSTSVQSITLVLAGEDTSIIRSSDLSGFWFRNILSLNAVVMSFGVNRAPAAWND